MRTAEYVVFTDCPPGPGRAERINAQVFSLNLDVHIFRLRQNRDGDRGSMNPALLLGRRHALHAVHSTLIFQARKHPLPFESAQ